MKDFKAGRTKDFFWFKAKLDLINILMKKVCKKNERLKILNIGSGTGDDLRILNKFGSTYIADINIEALNIINNDLCYEKKIADACNLPYENNFFDIVVSFDVFEHIKNDQKAIDEIYRTLKENGVLIFTVPAFQILFSSHDKALHHYRRYNLKNLKKLFSVFKKTKFLFWNSFLFIPFAVNRIINKTSKPKVEHINLPRGLNSVLYNILLMDNFLIKKNLSMPVGLTIAGYCHK